MAAAIGVIRAEDLMGGTEEEHIIPEIAWHQEGIIHSAHTNPAVLQAAKARAAGQAAKALTAKEENTQAIEEVIVLEEGLDRFFISNLSVKCSERSENAMWS